MPYYRKAKDLIKETISGKLVLANQKGGKIVTDPFLLAMLEDADGKKTGEIIDHYRESGYPEIVLRFVLACLAESGFLLRNEETIDEKNVLAVQGELISVVIVSHNSLDWLQLCLPSLELQSYSPIEIILVDNASRDGTGIFLKSNYPHLMLVELAEPVPFAQAINLGIQKSHGKYFLLLNPDVILEADAVTHLYKTALENLDCGAVAAKLRLLRLPQYLNGVGNSIGSLGWGTDNGLGYLDLGQFDSWIELPSACFAATLIPRRAWEAVGNIDEKFPMYYEDIEWCYRARMFGKKIYLSSQAVMYHAFSGHQREGQGEGVLSPQKLHHVVYGRLRFTLKMLEVPFLLRFLVSYLFEDLFRAMAAVFSGRWKTLPAYLLGWLNLVHDIPYILPERRKIQKRRQIDDRRLFQLQKDVPMPLIWHGYPELTLDVILSFYWPWLTRMTVWSFPEFNGFHIKDPESPYKGFRGLLNRYKTTVRLEGWNGLLHRMLRQLQWKLRQL